MAEYILRDQAIIAVTGAKLPDVSASGLPIANGKRSVADCVRRLKDIPAADAIEQLSNAGSAYGRGWTLGYNAGREESKPRWIPVGERLPEKAGKYLVCGRWRGEPTEIWVCEFMTLGCLKGWTNNAANPVVSHWMPLPPAPKEE